MAKQRDWIVRIDEAKAGRGRSGVQTVGLVEAPDAAAALAKVRGFYPDVPEEAFTVEED